MLVGPVLGGGFGNYLVDPHAIGVEPLGGRLYGFEPVGGGTAITTTGSLSLSGTATGQSSSIASATGVLTLTGAGADGALGMAVATMSLAGAVTAVAQASAFGSISMDASSGAVAQAAGSGLLSFDAPSHSGATASAHGAFALSGQTLVDQALAGVVGLMSFSSDLIGQAQDTATGSMALAGTSSARGGAPVTGLLSLDVQASGVRSERAQGIVSLDAEVGTLGTFTTALGSLDLAADVNAQVTLSASAFAVIEVTAVGTATARAGGEISFDAGAGGIGKAAVNGFISLHSELVAVTIAGFTGIIPLGEWTGDVENPYIAANLVGATLSPDLHPGGSGMRPVLTQ